MLLYFKLLELLTCCIVVAMLISLVVLLEFFLHYLCVHIVYAFAHALSAEQSSYSSMFDESLPLTSYYMWFFLHITSFNTLLQLYLFNSGGMILVQNFEVRGYGSFNLATPAPLPAIQDFNY